MSTESLPSLSSIIETQKRFLDTIVTPVVITNLEGRIVYGNPSTVASLDKTLLGVDLTTLLAPEITDFQAGPFQLSQQALRVAVYAQRGEAISHTSEMPHVTLIDGRTVTAMPFPIRIPTTERKKGVLVGFRWELTDTTALTRLQKEQEFADFLLNISRLAHNSLNLDTVMRSIAEQMRQFINFDTLNIMLIKNGSDAIDFSFTYGYDKFQIPPPQPSPETSISGMPGTLMPMRDSMTGMVISDTHEDPRWIRRPPPTPNWGSYAAAPLMITDRDGQKRVIGFVNINKLERGAYNNFNLERYQNIVYHIASAIENAQLYARDPLTNALNMGYFKYLLDKEVSRAMRHNHPLSLIAIDIDHFKQFNDTYGHLAGDRLLEILVMICEATTRNGDLIFRIGGEEFAILLPESKLDGAYNRAEKLRSIVETLMPYLIDQIIKGHDVTYEEIYTLVERVRNEPNLILTGSSDTYPGSTISVGVSELSLCEPRDSRSFRQSADDALYRAKRSGRNRVA